MFNKPTSEAGLLNNRLCLAAALGVTELTPITIILVTLCCVAQVRLRCSTNPPLGWTFDIVSLVTPKAGAKHELSFNQSASEAGLLNKCSSLAPALGVTKFRIMRDMILITLCCAT
jgi:hypothetical protein